jgi:hypothetical protein
LWNFKGYVMCFQKKETSCAQIWRQDG